MVSKYMDTILTSGIFWTQAPGLWRDELRFSPALGLVCRQEEHPQGWKSPGHCSSQVWDPGGSSTQMLWRCLQQPAGAQGKWHDARHDAGRQSMQASGSKNSLGLCHMGRGCSSASNPQQLGAWAKAS